MPRVYERKAAKAYPKFGIEKGQTYFDWTMKTGPRSSRNYKSLKRPRQSQLTGSAFLSGYYGLIESVEDATCVEDVESIAEDLRSLGSDENEKYENMPENLQQGPTGELLSTRATSCDSVADEIESLVENFSPNEPEEPDEEDEEDDDEAEEFDDGFGDLRDEILEALGNVDCG